MGRAGRLDEPADQAEGPSASSASARRTAAAAWPDSPQPISPPAQRLVYRRARRRRTRAIQDVLRHVARVLLGPPRRMRHQPDLLAQSTDGGRRGRRRSPLAVLPIPSSSPRSPSATFTVPIMDVGRRGELYVSYADYNPLRASTPDEDGMQGGHQALSRRSTPGRVGARRCASTRTGRTPTSSSRTCASRRAGQLEHQLLRSPPRPADLPSHPGNFFIDTWLSRSNNRRRDVEGHPGIATTRGTRRSTRRSPGSGAFIGDYQGWSRTMFRGLPFRERHASRERSRPRPGCSTSSSHDRPSSRCFASLVPNSRKFGGRSGDCRKSTGAARARRGTSTARQGRRHTKRPGRRARRAARSPSASTSAAIALAKRSQLIPDAPLRHRR
jgi:hypothetical protein